MATNEDSGGFGALLGKLLNRELIIALALVCVLGLLIVPLSPGALDFLLALSISLSLVVFLVSFFWWGWQATAGQGLGQGRGTAVSTPSGRVRA